MSTITEFHADTFDSGKNILTFRNTTTNESLIIRVQAVQHITIDQEFLHIVTEASHHCVGLAGINSAGGASVGLFNTISSVLR
ncbi:MAG: hypothetical protein EA428_04535 [Spirochaetaceae bacterium]|nr:MAG: hypothetical protein EA428_04535 [Spirochaetaceae bacterium]